MRDQLRKINNVRATFRGTVDRFGEKKAYKGPPIKTVMLRDVKDKHDRVMTDHLWFRVGLQLERLKLVPGDVLEFDARVAAYKKGYRGRRDDDDFEYRPAPGIDYGLSRPTKIRRIASGPAPPIANEPAPETPKFKKPALIPDCTCKDWPGPREDNGHHQYCRKKEST